MVSTRAIEPSSLTRETFPVLQMSCAACAVSVESTLKSVDGVTDAGVNFANQTAWVEFNSSKVKPRALQQAVQSIGYDLVVDVEDPQAVQAEAQQKHYETIKRRTIWSSLLALPVVVIGMFFMDLPYGNYISMILAAPVVFYFGRVFFINAFRLARIGNANMDTLVALSTGIAFIFSAFNTFFPSFWHSRGLHAHVYFEAATVVIAFISLGKLLEERAKSNTSSAIRKLMSLQPKTVWIRGEDGDVERPIVTVQAGETVVVKPGARIPLDGTVSAGASWVDESMISGEAAPVEKSAGTKVFAGTVNQRGSFEFVVDKVGSETVLAHIIKMVQEAQGSKAPVQKMVDKIAGIFVPVVIGIAIITFATWMIAGGTNAFTHALLASITVLVIACPCALGLATPTAIMVGVGKAAENNILIKDAESLEQAHKVNALVLDKTGTITEGKPAVTDIAWSAETSDRQAHWESVLMALESRSEHPLATAVVSFLKDRHVEPTTLDQFESITGLGVQGILDGKSVGVGTLKLLEQHHIAADSRLSVQAAEWQKQGKTVMHFFGAGSLLSVIAVADRIKATSAQAVRSLQQMGISVYMHTGDNATTAKSVADQVGIEHFTAEAMPSTKAEFVRQLQHEGKVVAMVGDGINDAQALAEANVSIAMGKGSDIAIDAAKVTLITSDLQLIPKALHLSTRTVRTIRENLFWAFIYNLIGIPIAAGVLYPINGFLLDPMIAGAAMALSSVSVVTNSLRLRFVRL